MLPLGLWIPWFVLATSDPLYGWNFVSQPSDTIASNTPRSTETATLHDGALRTVSGITVTGSPSFIDLGTLTFGGDLTFELIFTRATGGSAGQILFSCTDGTHYVKVDSLFGEDWTLRFFNSDGHIVTFKFHVNIMYALTHVIFTADVSNTVSMYVNGISVGADAAAPAAAIPDVTRPNCHLGSAFKGEIHYFNIYDSVLTQEEVTAAYDKSLGIFQYGWQFNNQPFNDIPGLRGDATLQAGALRTVDGVSVTGDSSFIELGTLKFGGDFTLELIFNSSSDSPPNKIFSCGELDAIHLYLEYDATLKLTHEVYPQIQHWDAGTNNITWKDSVAHVVVTMQTATSPRALNMYMDGAQIGSVNMPMGTLVANIPRTNCHLGHEFQGMVRSFNVYDSVLSPDEVTAAYNKAMPHGKFNATKLFGWTFTREFNPYFANKFVEAGTCPATLESGGTRDMYGSFNVFINYFPYQKGPQALVCAPEWTHPNDCPQGPPGYDYKGSELGPNTPLCALKKPNCDDNGGCPAWGPTQCRKYNWGSDTHTHICMYQAAVFMRERWVSDLTTFRSTIPPYPQLTVPPGAFKSAGGRGVRLSGLPGVANLDVLNAGMSIHMQVWVHAASGTGSILACDADGALFQLYLEQNDKLAIAFGGTTWTGSVIPNVRSHIAITVAANGTFVIYLNGDPDIRGNANPLSSEESFCSISPEYDTTFSSLNLYAGVTSHAEVITAFQHCSEEPPAPTPATPAGESDGTSTLTVVALIAAGVTLTASTVGMFALGVVSLM